MSDVRIRTRRANDIVYIDLLLDHPMESGRQQDGQGTTIPPWYLQDLTLSLNKQIIAAVTLGPQVSKNPVLSLALRASAPGDFVKVHWRDSRGDQGERSAKLA